MPLATRHLSLARMSQLVLLSSSAAPASEFRRGWPVVLACFCTAVFAWGFGFLGFWGPSTTLTAEVFPTRIRGVANGVVWFIGYFVGFVLWPFTSVALQQATGSFALAFLTIPVFMVAMAAGVWFTVPEHAGEELDAIAV